MVTSQKEHQQMEHLAISDTGPVGSHSQIHRLAACTQYNAQEISTGSLHKGSVRPHIPWHSLFQEWHAVQGC